MIRFDKLPLNTRLLNIIPNNIKVFVSIVFIIVLIVISVSKLKRLIFYRKWKLDLKTTALSNEDDIIKAQLEYAFMVSKRKKLLRIYKNLKKRKSLSSKGVLKFKSKFDAIYNQTMAE